MIRTTTLRELLWLLGEQEPPCITIQMPTHRHRPGTEQDPIRYRGLLRRAAELLAADHPGRDVRKLLAPLEALDDAPVWNHSLDGLAVFRSAGTAAAYRLPVPLPELVVVSDTFHTKSLVRFLQANRRYFVLSLSQNAVTLFVGTPHSLDPVEVAGLPAGLDDALGARDGEAPHRGVRGGPARGAGTVHFGHGAGGEEHKGELVKYFRAVDGALAEVLRDETAPLVLAGVGYTRSLYREVSRTPGLLPEGVEGNVERASADEIRAKAWPIVERVFAAEIEERLAAFSDLLPRRRADTDLSTVARAVAHGRVRDLFVCEGQNVWGRLDRETGEIHLREGQVDSRDADILDDLAEMALMRGAAVRVLAPERMPGGAAVAAIFRY
jgi:hypothetical protein